MPAGLKSTSSPIQVSEFSIELVAGTFVSEGIDLSLNPLDQEVFVVYGIDLDCLDPNLVPGTTTSIEMSLSTTARTAVGNIGDSNVMASARIQIQSAAGETARADFASDSAPAAQLEYIGIIATNDFFLNIKGSNNTLARAGNARLYGVRAKADASVYAALVQSELLSA